MISSLFNSPIENLLEGIEEIWLRLYNNMDIVTQIMIWFERCYLLKKKIKTKTIEKLILNVLYENMNNNPEIKTKIIEQLLNFIQQERDHNIVNKIMLKNIITMIIKIDIYKDLFEPEFFRLTELYYKNESLLMINTKFEITKYLNNTEYRITEEINRINEYLDKSSENKLVTILERLFISDNLQVILTNGFEELMEGNIYHNLKQIYYFLNKVNKIDFLKKTWGYYIKTKGTLLMNIEDISVEKILDFKNVLDHVLNNCFDKSLSLKNALHYAFEDFINLKTNKIAELTSKYLDEKLKKAHKLGISESELESKLEEVLSIFRFLQAKDVFEAFYTKRLVKRLLLGNISSYELEFKMIDKFKAECGVQYTKKSEDIFKDFEISKTLNIEFQSYEHNTMNNTNIEFSICVFSTNSWPLKNDHIQKFPPPVMIKVSVLTNKYK